VEPTTVEVKWSNKIHNLQELMEKQLEKSKKYHRGDPASRPRKTTLGPATYSDRKSRLGKMRRDS